MIPVVSADAATVTAVTPDAAAAFAVADAGGRKGIMIVNDTDKDLYVKFGTACSSTDFSFKLTAGQTYESYVEAYRGVVTGRSASAPTAGGKVRVTTLGG
jgi:hypothetical protein